jgi:hypothetical protein
MSERDPGAETPAEKPGKGRGAARVGPAARSIFAPSRPAAPGVGQGSSAPDAPAPTPATTEPRPAVEPERRDAVLPSRGTGESAPTPAVLADSLPTAAQLAPAAGGPAAAPARQASPAPREGVQAGAHTALEDAPTTKVTVGLHEPNILYLDRLATEIRAEHAAPVKRAELLRAICYAVQDAGVEISAVKDADDLQRLLTATLRAGKRAGEGAGQGTPAASVYETRGVRTV